MSSNFDIMYVASLVILHYTCKNSQIFICFPKIVPIETREEITLKLAIPFMWFEKSFCHGRIL